MRPSAQPLPAVVTPMLQLRSVHPVSRTTLNTGGRTSVFEATAGALLWPALTSLTAVYPGFENWYWGKVLDGVANGRRKIFVVGAAEQPLAIAIAKRELDENKVCTLWVSPRARGSGIGSELLGEVVDWLDDQSPLLTVPAERYPEFVPLVRRYGFVETARMRSLYRPGVVEHVFNGTPRSFRAS